MDDVRKLVPLSDLFSDLSDDEFSARLLERLEAFESNIPPGGGYADLRDCIDRIRRKLREPASRGELNDALDLLRQQIGSDK